MEELIDSFELHENTFNKYILDISDVEKGASRQSIETIEQGSQSQQNGVEFNSSPNATWKKFSSENVLLRQKFERQLAQVIPPMDRTFEILKKYRSLADALVADDRNAVRIMVEHGVSDINVRIPSKAETIVRPGYSQRWIVDGKNALEKAVEWSDATLVKLLLSKGASPLAHRQAIGKQRYHMGPTTLYESRTAAHDVIESGKIEILRIFLDGGMDINSVCFCSYGVHGGQYIPLSLLQAAQNQRRDEIALFLLGKGAKI